MELKCAADTLSALAHEGRLGVFKLLVEAGMEGRPAGEIARRLGMRPNTLSANLTILEHAGLASSRREGRSIIYTARYDRMTALMAFLVKDCCGGSPEVCASLAHVAGQALRAPAS